MTFPYESSTIGERHTPLARIRYQLAGAVQKPSIAWFDPAHGLDPERWLSGRLGPLAKSPDYDNYAHTPARVA